VSYEGYDKILCRNGHLHHYDTYQIENPFSVCSETSPETWRCRYCDEPLAWYTSIDQTNGDEVDPETGLLFGDVQLIINEPEIFEICSSYQRHVIEPTTYRIPLEGGHLVKAKP
jgi:hypothetical protein